MYIPMSSHSQQSCCLRLHTLYNLISQPTSPPLLLSPQLSLALPTPLDDRRFSWKLTPVPHACPILQSYPSHRHWIHQTLSSPP